MAEALFYVLGALALIGAAGVVLAKSPMFSVISLLGTFFALSVIYLLAGFQFMAAVQIVVYAGAILVLVLFVIMLLDLGDTESQLELSRSLFTGARARLACVVGAALGLVGLLAAQRGALESARAAAEIEGGIDALPALANALFGRYGLAFEATGVLLLVTMVAVVALAKRDRGARTAQGPGDTEGGA